MGDNEDNGPAEEVGEALEEAGLAEPVVVRDHGRWHRVRRITRRGILVVMALATAAGVVLWTQRKPIADRYIADELAKRGVTATYNLDKVGLRTQEISYLVIGDPARPDLTVEHALLQLRVRLNGSVEVYRLVARGVRLQGRLVDGRLSFGDVDKLLPEPGGKPFTLPTMVVDLSDTTVGLATPYGPVGVAVEGRGNLSGGFKGRLVASAPSMHRADCTAEALKASLAIGVEATRPHFAGPVTARSITCSTSQLALDSPRVETDVSFDEAFAKVKGDGRLMLPILRLGDDGLAGISGKIGLRGDVLVPEGNFDLSARQAKFAGAVGQRSSVTGSFAMKGSDGKPTLNGRFALADVALPAPMVKDATASFHTLGGTPLEPVAEGVAHAIERAAARFDLYGAVRMSGGKLAVTDAELRAASGARVRLAGKGMSIDPASGTWMLDGQLNTSGGGLPMASIALRQSGPGAPFSGEARVEPYRTGGGAIALSTIKFTGNPSGWTEIRTQARIDGPFAGGRVRGLIVPVAGRVGSGGALRFGEGCINVAMLSLEAGSLKLGPSRLPLCATDGAIIQRTANGKLAIGLASRAVKLRGALGKSPFALDAASARFTMGTGFSALQVAARVGNPEAPVLIDVERVDGRFAGSGARGDFEGGRAIIGTVPVALGDMAGNWQVHKAVVDIDGGLTASDRANPSRFYPLRSDDVRFRLSNSLINVTGTLKHPYSGETVTAVRIDHDLKSGDGHADLDVAALRFGPNLQPEELTRLTEGSVALVEGRVSGRGRIDWSGDGTVRSTGDFSTQGMNLAASFGPVTGLSGTIHFSDLLGLETPPGQRLTIDSVNPGIVADHGVVHYQLLPDNLVKIESGEWPFMGGKLTLHETILNFAREAPRRLTFEVAGLDAKRFVDSMGFAELKATGFFDGVLPMIFDLEGGRVVGGRLDSQPGGGTLAYNGVINRANLGMFGGMAFDALRDLRYKSMIIRLDGFLDGEFATRLTVDEVGLGNTSTQQLLRSINRIPFKFNVTVKGPFRALIATAKSFYDPTQVIRPALPMPLDDIPGITLESRRIEEVHQQDQSEIPDGKSPPSSPVTKPEGPSR